MSQRIPGPGYVAVVDNAGDRVDLGGGVTVPRRVTVRTVPGREPNEPRVPQVEVDVETGADRVPRCRAVRLVSAEGGRDVQASDLRGTSIEDLIVTAIEATGQTATGTGLAGWGGLEELRAHLDTVAAAARETRRGVRRRVTDELLDRVAEVYRASPSAPTKAVAEAFGVAHRTATLYVRHARDAGRLPAIGGES